jgi:hypothetical protein
MAGLAGQNIAGRAAKVALPGGKVAGPIISGQNAVSLDAQDLSPSTGGNKDLGIVAASLPGQDRPSMIGLGPMAPRSEARRTVNVQPGGVVRQIAKQSAQDGNVDGPLYYEFVGANMTNSTSIPDYNINGTDGGFGTIMGFQKRTTL